ncbi:hypothetical protein TEPIDINF_002137 [Tepidibacillus infernus]|uniref:capsular polysaccharide export protein, LipB/KpsS family n=1 Tax=Tepidibacillus infernus TaxID=1806172 RepID=UPI003B6C8628
MNILILINNAPGYIIFLKKMGDFFKKQGHIVIYACESHLPEIKYTTPLSIEEKYYFTQHVKKANNEELIEYEKMTNLRKFYYSCFDRNFHYNVNHDKDKEMDSTILRLLDYYGNIFKKHNIDLVLYENVSNSFAYAAYMVAKKNKKKYFGLITSRIPNRYEIWEDEYGNIDKRKENFEELNIDSIPLNDKDYIIKYLESVHLNKAMPDYMINNPMNIKINYFYYYLKKIHVFNRYIEYYLKYPEDVKGAYQSAYPIKASYKFVMRNLKRKLKISLLKKMYDSFEFSKEKFFLLPLHYQPESSTSVNAMYYDNQYEFVKNVAFSLPIGISLFVKDHPNGIGFADLDFYKKIKRLPNVKYINPLSDTKELINNSKGVITLTSTMGYEALLLEKPVITLGKVFYNYHPYCYNISGYNELYDTVRKVLSQEHKDFMQHNLKFLYIYYNDTYEGKVFNKESNFSDIYNSIITKMGKNI